MGILRYGQYGPGLAAEYFIDNENRDGGNGVFANGGNELGNLDQDDINLLSDVTPLLKTFASKYPLAIEMGRFLASSCGTYYSEVKDIKKMQILHMQSVMVEFINSSIMGR